MTPTFSIIIPVYNVAPYLRECLDSVLAQTYTSWEALCVDDGSTDGSGAILDEYAAKDPRFRVIHQKNAGVSAARNKALQKAQGEYFGFVDADDSIEREFLVTVKSGIDRFGKPEWLRIGGCVYLEADGKRVVSIGSAEDCISGSVSVVKWGLERLLEFGCVCGNFYSQRIKSFVHFPEGVRYGEDDLQQIGVIPHVRSAAQIRCSGYVYRCQRQDAASRSVSLKDVHILLDGFESSVPSYRDFLGKLAFDGEIPAVVTRFALKFLERSLHMTPRKQRTDLKPVVNKLRSMQTSGLIRFDVMTLRQKLWMWWLVYFESLFAYDAFVVLSQGKAKFLRRS